MSKTTWITIYHHELILTGSALFVIGLELTGLTEHEVERCEDEALEQGHSMIHVRLRLGLVCSLSRKNHAEMEKKMTTPTLPPPAMTSWKKIRSGPRGRFSSS